MGFLQNDGDIILDAVLTDTGRMRLAKGDGSFKISKFINSSIKFLLFLMLFCWTSPYAPICLYSIIFIIFSTDLKFNFIEKK